jgi:parvulin-like peptidyl-prolyl isomerase
MTSDQQSPVSLDIDIRDVFAQIRLNNDAFLITEALEDILIARLAQQAGITALDSEVDAEIDAFRVRLGLYKAEDLTAWLAERGLDGADLSEKFRQMVRKEKLAKQVTDPVIADHYLQHRAEYDLFNLSQIVVADVAEAHEILRQLTREGRDFAELARHHSLDTETAEQGGLLGRCKRRDLPAHFAAELASTTPGRVHVFGPFEIAGRFVIHQASLERESQLDLPLRIEIRRTLFADWLSTQKEAAGLADKAASLLQHRRTRAEEKPEAVPQPRFSRRDIAAGIVATALSADFVARDQARYAFDRTNAPQPSGPTQDPRWAPAGAWRQTAQKQSSPPPPPPPRPRPRNPPAVAGVRG